MLIVPPHVIIHVREMLILAVVFAMQLQVTEIMIGIITINGSTTWEELSDIVQTSFKVLFVTGILWNIGGI